jgi:cobalt-zinc-cadmium efflux system membrane fusion protein
VGSAVAALGLVACRGAAPAPQPADRPATAQAVSEEGTVCAEHGVLEAVCTKCNPALIPVFKAKGDWCAEHGFPESFCPVCHPERDGRPQRGAVQEPDGAPADGTRVRFKDRETARLAGLQVVQAVPRPGAVDLVVTARVVYDATKVAPVSARAPGIVRAVLAEVGAEVRPGTPLALIESAGLAAERSRASAARSRVAVAEANHARLSGLLEEGIVAEKDVLAASQELAAARAELATAEAALGLVEGAHDQVARYTLTAPIAGEVTRRRASVGRLVGTDEALFEVVDTSTMWAELDVPEADVSRVAVGQRVGLEVDGLPGRSFAGTLDYLAPEIDEHSRTLKSRVRLANPGRELRANMFAKARIAVPDAGPGVVVPLGAVQQARGAPVVFVRLAEDLYEARRVRLGAAHDGLVEVAGRIAAGDSVVTEGSFLLKTETLKDSIGAGCCEVEERR